ncbi:50S ribosomal protein L11 methyltransferase [Victivallis sp. Marseille-Q1083]|uniref:50S ribosomal protein L11 methyltransferase n=1 Tax=Victivallis sp. Marseille-Q1083 TaxID=2717288 RepID=UPI001589FE86|nr:50S ribosomal protein L11 methyltransferase [Victivallis sp. Marseille-Q1083]
MSELLYCCKMRDLSDDYNQTVEFLSALDAYVGTWENREEKSVWHTVYTLDKAAALAAMAQLQQLLPLWAEYGIRLSAPEYFELPKEDWSEVWKKYFHLIHIADNLVIRPSWLAYEPKPGQAVVDIDPGMSFGTGQHATTAYCLKTLARLAGRPEVRSVLDAGCGSGILAIAAGKLGYRPIDAFDYDPDAVKVAAENIAINQLTGQIRLFQGDAVGYEAPEGGYDLALVNILGHILKANARRIVGWVRPGGYLALAGILNSEFDALAAVFTDAGGRELDRFTEKEWTSGLFCRN